MKIIIFSKNRAMQLDALLRSLPTNSDISIIYMATNGRYQKGYDKLIDIYKYDFFKQDQKHDLKHLLLQIFIFHNNHEYLSFMVDDDIVYDNNFPGIKLNQNECYSLRLHPGIDNIIHYTYTMSLDGNIYRTKDIDKLIIQINFDNPNQLESALQGRYGKNFKMLYGKGHLIGFNHNRVSDSSHCAFTGCFNEEYLNKLFLMGFYIDFESMKLSQTNNVHTSQKYLFKKASI